jgi:hypothetical protein
VTQPDIACGVASRHDIESIRESRQIRTNVAKSLE